MPQNFFVTGLPKSGKTTLLRRIIKDLKEMGLKVGGFISPEQTHNGARSGFYVEDIETGRIELLADKNVDGPKVSKYHVDIKSFESVSIPAMERFRRYDVMIIDEIGRMELKSARFSELLDRVLDSGTPLVASLHNDFIEKYGAYGNVLYLTGNNHEDVYDELLEGIKSYRERRKAAPKKEEAKKAKMAPQKKMKGKKYEEPEEEEPKKEEGEEKREKGPAVMEKLRDLLGF